MGFGLVLALFSGASPVWSEAATQTPPEVTRHMLQPFMAHARWFALPIQAPRATVALVSEWDVVGRARMISLLPDGGYVVSLIRVSCPVGVYAVRTTKRASADRFLPVSMVENAKVLDVSTDLRKICDRSARLPTFTGSLSTAIPKARELEARLTRSGEIVFGEAVPVVAKP